MAHDLNKLNQVLFETLNDVKEGKIDEKRAQTIVNIGNSIVNNAKIQLAAYKLTGGKTGISLMSHIEKQEETPKKENDIYAQAKAFVESPTKPRPEMNLVEDKDRAEKALQLAKAKGYKNTAEAIAVMGRDAFSKALEAFMNQNDAA